MSKHAYSKVDIEAVKILQESTYEINTASSGDISITHDSIQDEIIYYSVMLKFISKIERLDAPPAIFGKRTRNDLYPLTKDGVELKEAVTQATKIHKHQEFYNIHPKLAFLCDFVVNHDLAAMIDDACVNSSTQVNLHLKYKELLSELKSYPMMEKCYAFLKGPQKNAESLRNYVDGLFKHYARLLVIRVDLAYESAFRNFVNIDDVIRHKNELFKRRNKRSIAKDWVGYACRLEYAPRTGWHYHLIVFMNGAKFASDVMHAFNIITEWKRITLNMGRGHSCNRNTNMYRFCGIGLVDHYDTAKRANLKMALAYLTKSDNVAKLRLKGRRTFFKGTLPKKVTNRGRPRVRRPSKVSLIRVPAPYVSKVQKAG